ncbi:E3 ubiquitin-protein ligase TRIM45-like [Haliotis asinina]|uniref:E3 ubiquitin-protein ligase TRIM45-like n=1 Tax=Haliotis asinina TaxID=109174 RepID=UPI00353265DA
MSDMSPSMTIRNILIKCPACLRLFDESRVPHRLTCCLRSVCEPCLLGHYAEGTLQCPLCRQRHRLPNDVGSLPQDTLMQKFMEKQKVRTGSRLPCTDCPDNHEAEFRCEDCCVYMCKECHTAHARSRFNLKHEVNVLEKLRGRSLNGFRVRHKCSEHHLSLDFFCKTCEVVICMSCSFEVHDKNNGHTVVTVKDARAAKALVIEDNLTKLEEKALSLGKKVGMLEKTVDRIVTARQESRRTILATFDKLLGELKLRRAVILSDVEDKSNAFLMQAEDALEANRILLNRIGSSIPHMRELRSKADKTEDLQLMASSAASLTAMLEEIPLDLEFARAGVSFVPANSSLLKSTIQKMGLVRSVVFTPIEKPRHVEKEDMYNFISLKPMEIPQVAFEDAYIGAKAGVFSPYLEWDPSTVSSDVTVSETLVSNVIPEPPPRDAGSRLKAHRHVMTSKPVTLAPCQCALYQLKVRFSVIEAPKENNMIFETALTNKPVDANWFTSTGLSVCVVVCENHEGQLCLKVIYDGKILTDEPLIENKAGESRDLLLCVVLDNDKKKMHVVDVADARIVRSIMDVDLDKSMWVMMALVSPQWAKCTGQLMSGSCAELTPDVTNLLSSLC